MKYNVDGVELSWDEYFTLLQLLVSLRHQARKKEGASTK